MYDISSLVEMKLTNYGTHVYYIFFLSIKSRGQSSLCYLPQLHVVLIDACKLFAWQ